MFLILGIRSNSFALNPFIGSDVCDLEIIVPEDVHLCDGEDYELCGNILGDYDDYVWYENDDDTNYDLCDDIDVEEETTFTLVATFRSEENLVYNGDFEDGNVGFDTDYEYTTFGDPNCYGAGFIDCEGTYSILDNPNDGHSGFSGCNDYIGGGNMMVVNGAPAFQEIWCQEICIDPEGTFVLSAYAASVNPGSPAELQVSVDGELIGELFELTSNVCQWEYFEAIYEAEGETSIEICITNQNTATGGNDFALDGIELVQICEEAAEFTVTVSELEIEGEDPEMLNCNLEEIEITIEVDTPYDIDVIDWDTDDGFITDISRDDLTITVDEAGLYIVTVTDEFGCEFEKEFEVEESFEEPEAELFVEDILSCNIDFVILSVESDIDDPEFEWIDPNGEYLGDDDEEEAEIPGIYELIITDLNNGCTEDFSIEVLADNSIPEFDLISSGDLTCSNTFVTIFTDTPISEVNWTTESGELISSNNDTIQVGIPGNYYAEVILDNGCFHLDTVEVSEIAPNFLYEKSAELHLNCNEPEGKLSIFFDVNLFELEWLNNTIEISSDNEAIISEAGWYSFLLVDEYGCTNLDSIRVTQDFEQPNYNSFSTRIECDNPNAVAYIEDPEDKLRIEWENLDPQFVFGDTTVVNSAGYIYFSVLGTNGCTKRDSILIESSEDFPEVEIVGEAISCTQPQIELSSNTSSDIVSYRWNTPGGIIRDVEQIVVEDAGIYFLEVTNSEGCSTTSQFEVEVDTLSPQLEKLEDIYLNCLNDSELVALSLDSEYSFINWSGPVLNPTEEANLINEAGTYSIEVTANNGCSTKISFEVYLDTIQPTISLTEPNILDCNTDRFKPTLSSDLIIESYTWTLPDGSFTQNEIEDITTAGTYSIEVTANNGCTNESSYLVQEDYSKPSLEYTASTYTCNTPYFEINATSDNDAILSYIQNGALVEEGASWGTNSLENLYVHAEGLNGCEDQLPIVGIYDTAQVQFALSSGLLDCNNTETSIEITSADNLEFINLYSPSGDLIPDATQNIDEAGLYTIEVAGNNGCFNQQTILVESDYSTISFDLDAENLSCIKDAVPIEILTTEVFTQAELYNENGILLSSIFNNTDFFLVDSAGNFTVELQNSNGCISSENIEVIRLSDSPELALFEIDILDCEGQALFSNLTIEGGTGPYEAYLDNNFISLEENIIVTEPGPHILEIVDFNGCTLYKEFETSAPEKVNADIIPEISIREGDSLKLELLINKPLNDIASIEWYPQQDLSCYDCLSPQFTGNQASTYNVKVVDKYGCESEVQIRILVDIIIKIYIPNAIILDEANNEDARFTIFSGIDHIKQIDELLIYDRWGNLVFLNNDFPSNDVSYGWDGYFKGSKVEPGVYVYSAIVTYTNDVQERFSGDLTVIR